MNERALCWKYLKSSFALLFGAIWALVGTVFFFAGGVPLVVSSASPVEAASLEGRVVEKGEDADKDGHVRHWLRFSWKDESGAERNSLVETDRGTWDRTSAGGLLALAPPSGAEASPRIAGSKPAGGELWIFVAIGVVFGGIGWGLVVYAVRKSARRAKLLLTGNATDATITGVEQVTNVRINGRNPLVLLFEYRDDAGERRSGRSPYLPRALEQRWQHGSRLRIAYDPLRPEICEADIFDALAT